MQIETENLDPTVDSIVNHAITVISKFKIIHARLKIFPGLLLKHKITGELRYYYASQNSYRIGGENIVIGQSNFQNRIEIRKAIVENTPNYLEEIQYPNIDVTSSWICLGIISILYHLTKLF